MGSVLERVFRIGGYLQNAHAFKGFADHDPDNVTDSDVSLQAGVLLH